MNFLIMSLMMLIVNTYAQAMQQPSKNKKFTAYLQQPSIPIPNQNDMTVFDQMSKADRVRFKNIVKQQLVTIVSNPQYANAFIQTHLKPFFNDCTDAEKMYVRYRLEKLCTRYELLEGITESVAMFLTIVSTLTMITTIPHMLRQDTLMSYCLFIFLYITATAYAILNSQSFFYLPIFFESQWQFKSKSALLQQLKKELKQASGTSNAH